MADTALVSGSRFENLLIRINEEKEALLTSELNEGRRRDLLKLICSVYFFLRKVAGMAKRDMTLEEFEIVEKKLKEMSQEAIKKSRHRILKALGFKTAWTYYHKYGYFHIKRTPFGNWYMKHAWVRREWNNFDPYKKCAGSSSAFYSMPPNAKNLLDELFEKRFGEKIDQESEK